MSDICGYFLCHSSVPFSFPHTLHACSHSRLMSNGISTHPNSPNPPNRAHISFLVLCFVYFSRGSLHQSVSLFVCPEIPCHIVLYFYLSCFLYYLTFKFFLAIFRSRFLSLSVSLSLSLVIPSLTQYIVSRQLCFALCNGV